MRAHRAQSTKSVTSCMLVTCCMLVVTHTHVHTVTHSHTQSHTHTHTHTPSPHTAPPLSPSPPPVQLLCRRRRCCTMFQNAERPVVEEPYPLKLPARGSGVIVSLGGGGGERDQKSEPESGKEEGAALKRTEPAAQCKERQLGGAAPGRLRNLHMQRGGGSGGRGAARPHLQHAV